MKRTTIILAMLAGFALVDGALGYWLNPSRAWPSGYDVAAMLCYCLLIFLWYRADALERGYRRPVAMNIAVVAVSFIGLPVYFFASRRAGLAFRALGLAVLAFFAIATLNYGGAWASWFAMHLVDTEST